MELNFHICLVYIFLNKIKPKFVVESGIYKGQTTWLIEKTLPKAKILAIDINLESRTYILNLKMLNIRILTSLVIILKKYLQDL